LGIGFAWAIVELAPDGILVSDDDGRILMANRQVEDMFGYDRDRLVGAHVESLLPVRVRETDRAHRSKYVDAPATRPMGVGHNLLGLHADGSEFPVEISLSPIAADLGTATVVVIRDVSQQQARERAERATSVTDEDERIAAELHDRVIGHLFASGLTLASVLGTHQLDDGIAARLRDVIDELDAAAQEIRKIVFARLGHDPGTPRSA
jgi:PAS domain S-box-containing protein